MAKQKIKVGFPEQSKTYTAKETSRGYKMRVDSAIKLLEQVDGWKIKRARDYVSSFDGCVRETDDELTDLTEEDIERIKEKVEKYDYRTTVYPEEGKLDIWDVALGNWELKNSGLETA